MRDVSTSDSSKILSVLRELELEIREIEDRTEGDCESIWVDFTLVFTLIEEIRTEVETKKSESKIDWKSFLSIAKFILELAKEIYSSSVYKLLSRYKYGNGKNNKTTEGGFRTQPRRVGHKYWSQLSILVTS